MVHLNGSVGLHGRNRLDDVVTVQKALFVSGHAPGPIDGLCGRRTIAAIMAVQRRIIARPDALVEVHGPTWRRLMPFVRSASFGASPRVAARSSSAVLTKRSSAGGTGRTSMPSAAPGAIVPIAAAAAGRLNYTHHLPLPARGAVNVGIHSPSNRTVIAQLGSPRDSYSQDCQPPTNQTFKRMVVTSDVGPFRVTGLRPAVQSLAEIFAEVRRLHPQLYTKLGTAGMMCCRHVRGSTRSVSNHAWGTAIDMKIDGVLVPRKAHYANLGLQLLASIFNKHGWYWGATFSTPDPHHFECGADLLRTFHA
jgi:hypothetical protein